MSSDLNKSGELTKAVVHKLDALSASVDRRFATLSASVDSRFPTLSASLDGRFGAADEVLAERRQYTEFAFEQLRNGLKDEMKAGFEAVNARLDGHDGRFASLDRRFDSIDSRFDRLERKLDQVIDTQSRANELVERRLTALEAPSGHE